MDLNQLLYAHQLAAMGQAREPDHPSREAHADDAAQFAQRIGRLREDSGADVTGAAFLVGERSGASDHG